MPFYARAEYERTHSEDVKPKRNRYWLRTLFIAVSTGPKFGVRYLGQSSLDDPRLRDEPLSDGRWGK